MNIRIRIWLVLATLAVVAAGCASGTAPTPHAAKTQTSLSSPAVSSAVVPWIYAPTTPPPPPSAPPPPTRPADGRRCRISDVSAHLGESNGAGGHLLVTVRFRNVSTSMCVLIGYPGVVATEPGRPDVTGTDGSYFDSGEGSANMSPGSSTLLGLETDTYCAARPGGGGGLPRYHHLDVTLPGESKSIDLHDAVGIDITCGLRVSQFWVPQPPPELPQVRALTATLEMPSRITAGTVLVYVVDLANETDQPIALMPCPAYLQSVPGVKDIEALNCSTVDVIAPNHDVRFEMHMTLPASAPPTGRTTIAWWLISANISAKAQATIDVTAR